MKTWQEIKSDAQQKWWEVKWRIVDGCKRTIEWCENNKELAVVGGTIGVVLLKEGFKVAHSIDRKMDINREERLHELEVYDHSLGMYHQLKRPMRPEEKIELSIRVKNGESKVEVLRDMRLLG